MTRTKHLLCFAMALTVCALGEAVSAECPPDSNTSCSHRIGVGWDSGIGARYRIGRHWGLGVRLNPDLTDSESRFRRVSERPDETDFRDASTDSEGRTYGASIMLYREARIARWLGFGPYCELAFDGRRSEYRDDNLNYSSAEGDGTDRFLYRSSASTRSWTTSIGVRPTFTFCDRFALESRLGVALVFSDENTDRYYLNSAQIEGEYDYGSASAVRVDGNAWSVSFFGQELGPGATLTFMAYF